MLHTVHLSICKKGYSPFSTEICPHASAPNAIQHGSIVATNQNRFWIAFLGNSNDWRGKLNLVPKMEPRQAPPMDPEFIINNIPSRIVCTVVVYADMYTVVATNSLYTIYCSNSIFQHGSHIRSVFMSSCKATIYSSGLSFVSIISERHSTKTTLDTIITLNGKVRLNRFSDPAIFRPCVLHHVF